VAVLTELDPVHLLSCVTVRFVVGTDADLYSDHALAYIEEDIVRQMALPRKNDTADTVSIVKFVCY
jgi:hypothetical protein